MYNNIAIQKEVNIMNLNTKQIVSTIKRMKYEKEKNCI